MMSRSISFISFILLPLFLSACGGGSGSPSPSPAPSLSPSVLTKSASNSVIRALSLGQQGVNIRPTLLPATDGSEVIETRFKGAPSEVNPLSRLYEAVLEFKSRAADHSEKVFRIGTEGSIPFTQSCGSGSISHGGTEGDTTDDSFSISLNCSGGGATASGSFSSSPIKDVNGVVVQYRLAYGNYSLSNRKRIQLNQNMNSNLFSTENSFRSGTVLLDVDAAGTCFRGSPFESVAGTFNLTGTDQRDADGDNVFEVDEAFALTNLVITIAETDICSGGPVTIVMNGVHSFTDNNDASRSITSTFSNVQLIVSPGAEFINGILTNGVSNSLSGVMTVTSPNLCVDATHNITTATPFFVPSGASCAVLGKQRLTNTSSGLVTAVSATPTGGLDVDVGDDGSVEQNFADCQGAIVCTF